MVRYLTHVYNEVHRYKTIDKKVPLTKNYPARQCVVKVYTACSRDLKYLPAVGRIINISNNVHMTGVTGNVDRFYKIHVTEACRHLSEERTITAGSWG